MIDSSVKHWDPNTIKPEKSPYLNRLELGDYLKKAPKITPTSAAGTPFDTLNYNQVVAYKYFNRGERNPRVYNKRLNSLIDVIENQHAMNQSEADQFLRLLSARSTYGGMRMACFEPRLGIVFYKDGLYVNQISICMECNYLEAPFQIPALERQRKISEKHYTGDNDYGFSKKGRNGINQLLKEFKFGE
ncbi:hypothetical protein D3C71_976960 [compost metagenome]